MTQSEANALFELQEVIKFYGSLIGTPGLSQDNNDIANALVKECLAAAVPIITDRITEIRAQATGIITK